jgi:hypothetical protein
MELVSIPREEYDRMTKQLAVQREIETCVDELWSVGIEGGTLKSMVPRAVNEIKVAQGSDAFFGVGGPGVRRVF